MTATLTRREDRPVDGGSGKTHWAPWAPAGGRTQGYWDGFAQWLVWLNSVYDDVTIPLCVPFHGGLVFEAVDTWLAWRVAHADPTGGSGGPVPPQQLSSPSTWHAYPLAGLRARAAGYERCAHRVPADRGDLASALSAILADPGDTFKGPLPLVHPSRRDEFDVLVRDYGEGALFGWWYQD